MGSKVTYRNELFYALVNNQEQDFRTNEDRSLGVNEYTSIRGNAIGNSSRLAIHLSRKTILIP